MPSGTRNISWEYCFRLVSTMITWPLVVELPWPATELNPNSRCFWMTKARIGKRYRIAAAKAVALALIGRRAMREALAVPQLLRVAITFHPPTRASRDFDNMLASIKAGLDGVAKGAIDRDGHAVPGLPGLGVDDRHFRPTLDLGAPRKGGAVVLRIRPLAGVCPECGGERLGLDPGPDRGGSLLD